ncbi:hypothetical protein D3C71_2139070 [compost metagenome]
MTASQQRGKTLPDYFRLAHQRLAYLCLQTRQQHLRRLRPMTQLSAPAAFRFLYYLCRSRCSVFTIHDTTE